MSASILLATITLGQGTALPLPVERWASWLTAHTPISTMRAWTRPTWRLYPSSRLDPGYLSPSGDRILTLDGRLRGFRPPRDPDGGMVVPFGPDPVTPGGAADAAILLAQGRREEASVLVRTLTPQAVDEEIGRVVARHVWTRYARATNAYHRERDREALTIARSLVADLPELRAVLASRTTTRDFGNETLGFVSGLGGLVNELTHRVREPRREIRSLPRASVPDLVAGLREITGALRLNGGSGNYRWLAIVRELGRRGNAAVPLLLQALESDRLTRDVWSRDYSYTINVGSVFRPALEALNLIAGTHGLPGVEPTDDRAKIAATYRDFFATTSGLNRSQRALFLLDATADTRFWLDAAKTLSESASSPASGAHDAEHLTPEEQERAVSRLDARFDEAIVARPPRASIETLATLAIARTTLNPVGASLRLERATDASLASLRRGEPLGQSGNVIAQAFRRRILRGDATAIPQYEVWIRLVAVADARVETEWLAPLRELDSNAALAPTAHWVFESSDSAYLRDGYEVLASWGGSWRNGIGRLPRLLRAAFAHGLMDVTPIGTVRRDPNGELACDPPEIGGYWNSSSGRDELKPGESQVVRRCDRVAQKLSNHETLGVTFVTIWPLARRDAAIAEMRSRLAL